VQREGGTVVVVPSGGQISHLPAELTAFSMPISRLVPFVVHDTCSAWNLSTWLIDHWLVNILEEQHVLTHEFHWSRLALNVQRWSLRAALFSDTCKPKDRHQPTKVALSVPSLKSANKDFHQLSRDDWK